MSYYETFTRWQSQLSIADYFSEFTDSFGKKLCVYIHAHWVLRLSVFYHDYEQILRKVVANCWARSIESVIYIEIVICSIILENKYGKPDNAVFTPLKIKTANIVYLEVLKHVRKLDSKMVCFVSQRQAKRAYIDLIDN